MKHASLFMTGCIALCFGATQAAEWEQPYPKLGSCGRNDTPLFGTHTDPLFTQCMEDAGDEDYCSGLYPPIVVPYEQWAPTYHGNVERVFEDYIGKTPNDHLALRQSRAGVAQCTARGSDPASTVISQIAPTLEPWSEGGGPFRQADTAVILLEYLRIYECSLVERSLFLPAYIWREESDRRRLSPGGLAANPFYFTTLLELWSKQSRDIRRELQIARPTLERVLGFMGTVHMTRSFESDAECIQRASLDIRNALALSADTASCLPKIWNAKDPLRDPPACSDGRDNDDDGIIDLIDPGCSSRTDMSE